MRADVVAGIVGGIVVLPQGIAFATIAGMPPQYGLYASIAPTIVAALFGSSRHLVAGPSTTASLVLAASLSSFAQPGSDEYVRMAMTLALMTGLIELALGLLRMGVIVNFISHSVVVGYTAGVGVLIIITQLHGFFGIKGFVGHEFLASIRDLIVALPSISPWETAVAISTLLAGLVSRRYIKRVPYMLPAILVGCLVGYAANLATPGSIDTVGALPSSLPPLSHPSFDLSLWRLLLPTALAVAISALNEVTSISRALAIRSEQQVDINQEFVGQGLANIVSPFFSGYVVSGSFNRSALNYESGAQTQLSALTSGAVLVVLILVAAPLAVYLPKSAMAASLVLIGFALIDQVSIRTILRMSRAESWVFSVTVFVALFVHIQAAIFVGVGLSLTMYLYRTSNPQLRPRVPDPSSSSRKFTDVRESLPECPQVRLLRVDGSLYFGAVTSFRESMRRMETERPDIKQVALVMSGVNFIDLAGAEALALEARNLRAKSGNLYLIRVKERALEFLERGEYSETIGKDKIFVSKTAALREIHRNVNVDLCRDCKLRVFTECSSHARDCAEPSQPTLEHLVAT